MQKIGIEGWTIVHQARQKHYDDMFYGQFLATREDGRWMVGRMFAGESMDDGFRAGEWAFSQRFAGPRSTDNADVALEAYVGMSHVTYVWDRVFEQRVGEAIDQFWAGPEVPNLPKIAAGWQESDAGHRNPARGHTIPLPFHEAKYQLLQYLRRTELGAKAHLTRGVTIDRHQAVELVREATRPVRFEYGYNTYWLAS
ncbi:hypothetical protein [Streptomyces sp. NPDC088360]|uniref:hypothetical protein n=1 Tax=Streptomyces sp. NPDC088360 TaxID=3154515 RepID=UPI00344C1A61